jgi:GxxExxY protein
MVDPNLFLNREVRGERKGVCSREVLGEHPEHLSLEYVDRVVQILSMIETNIPENAISHAILAACLEVHKQLGPGLLEKAYETCLAHEFAARNISFVRQYPIPLIYKGKMLKCGFRADMIVEDKVLIEIKSVAAFHDVHRAQALTYLKLTGLRLCLLLNFNTVLLRFGIQRIVLGL